MWHLAECLGYKELFHMMSAKNSGGRITMSCYAKNYHALNDVITQQLVCGAIQCKHTAQHMTLRL